MAQDRRTFIKVISIASATLVPVAGALAKVFDKKEEELAAVLDDSFNSDFEFHLIDNNLLNLHFYFIGAKKKGNYILPVPQSPNSFMVVRLPQMHVSEKGFWHDDWNSDQKKLPDANLSGYSYLAFQLWPNQSGDSNGADKERKLKFTLDNILNWNNEQNFDLITLVEWLDLKNTDALAFADYKKCNDFHQKKIWNLSNSEVEKEFAESYYHKEKHEPKQSFSYKKYKSLVRHFLDQNLKPSVSVNTFVPITFLEFPQGVALVPIARDKMGLLAKNDQKPSKQFWQNLLVNQEKASEGFRKYEVWNNTLFYKTKLDKKTDQGPNFNIETPSFRIIGLITDQKIDCRDNENKDCKQAYEEGKAKNFLPSLLDKKELAFLTQFAKSEVASQDIDFTNKKFDIKESNGLFFTGLGVISHLKYYNEDAPEGIDLIEYEHTITQGRDIFIKVARIGIHNKNGKRYKHVIEGKRKIENKIGASTIPEPTSFIELKQYCECIEKIKNYEFPDNPSKAEWDAAQFKSPLSASAKLHPIFQPALSNASHYRRYPWKETRTTEEERIPIDLLQDQKGSTPLDNPACALWFWPVHEGTLPNPKYLLSKFEAEDWDNGRLNLETPFIFIRKSLLESNDTKEIDRLTESYFQLSYDDPTAHTNLRRRINIKDQKIAFTKPLPATNANSLKKNALEKAVNPSNSKTHILETAFIETYFDFTQKDIIAKQTFAKTRFPILPQVLRAKVYIDHIRELTLEKIPSVVEYQADYIAHGFKEIVDEASNTYANAAKLILANTNAFIEAKEEQANQTYQQIKTALQSAKDKLGNLAVPDIIPDAISLEKFGITLPKDMGNSIKEGRTVFDNKLRQIQSFNPRELLRGKLSNVCGLDLTAILDELIPATPNDNKTPLFEINKMLDKIEGEVLNSPIYQKIIAFEIYDPLSGDKLPPDQLIKRYNDKIAELRLSLELARLELNKKIKELSDELPNAEELDYLVKSLFEYYRTQAFQTLLPEIPFEKIEGEIKSIKDRANAFFEDAKPVLLEEMNVMKAKLTDFFENYGKELKILGKLPDEIKKIEGIDIGKYLEDKLNPFYNSVDFCGFPAKLNELYNTVQDTLKITVSFQVGTQVKNETLYYVADQSKSSSSITYELTDQASKGSPLLVFNDTANVKLLQLETKIEQLKKFVIRNIDGNDFQKAAAKKLQELLQKYNPILENLQKKAVDFQEVQLGKILKEIAVWKIKTDSYLTTQQNLTAETIDALIKIQGVISNAGPYIDLLRKCDPYFYYSQQQRLQKEIADIETRFKKEYFNKYVAIRSQVSGMVKEYASKAKAYANAIKSFKTIGQEKLNELNEERANFIAYRRSFEKELGGKSGEIIRSLINDPKFSKLKEIYEVIHNPSGLMKQVEDYQENLKKYLDNLKLVFEQQAADYVNELDKKVKTYLDEQEKELTKAIGQQQITQIQNQINEAKNIYRLLTAVKQQSLSYQWSTDNFRDVNLGIVSFKKFSNPNTTLKVDVRATTHFTSGKFPPTIEKVVTYSENRFTNFGIGFLNCITVGFNEITFIAGSHSPTHFDVKIKDVKFDGALSFVQAFESWLKTMGKGLILQINSDHAALGYSLPIPNINTPAFSFFNLSLNFDLRVYFDKRPLRFGFSLARPESKFGIAAGIYAGFGFFSIVADPKKGIVEIDCALEAGAWAGIRFGPFSGEVKLAFGFRYTKNEFGVRLEGYIVAEGRLSFWVFEVSARIYLGVVSYNNYVEGMCTVTYSVKLGFVKRSFSGTFRKKIAGAKSNNNDAANKEIALAHLQYKTNLYHAAQAKLKSETVDTNREISRAEIINQISLALENYEDEEIIIIEAVERKEWEDFVTLF